MSKQLTDLQKYKSKSLLIKLKKFMVRVIGYYYGEIDSLCNYIDQSDYYEEYLAKLMDFSLAEEYKRHREHYNNMLEKVQKLLNVEFMTMELKKNAKERF